MYKTHQRKTKQQNCEKVMTLYMYVGIAKCYSIIQKIQVDFTFFSEKIMQTNSTAENMVTTLTKLKLSPSQF